MKTIKLSDSEVYKFPTSQKELHNYFWNLNINVNFFKWLGYYDFIIDKKYYNTGLKTIDAMTFDDWKEFVLRSIKNKNYITN